MNILIGLLLVAGGFALGVAFIIICLLLHQAIEK